jgi:drug/metabolite transporter (DMT)-like permease
MSTTRREQVVGSLLVVGFDVLIAAECVYVGHAEQVVHPSLMLAVVITTIFVFFNALQLRAPGAYRAALRGSWSDVAWLNVLTIANWSSEFAALAFLEPAVVQSVTAGLNPLFVIALTMALRQQTQILRSDIWAALGIVVTTGFLVSATWGGHSAVGALGHRATGIGLVCLVVNSISSGGIQIVNKRLHERGFTSSQVMASQFFVLVVASWGYVLVARPAIAPLVGQLPAVVAAAVLGGIVAMYLLQEGIKRIEPITLMLISSLVAVLALAFQQLDSRLTFSWPSLCGVLGMVCLVLWSSYQRLRGAVGR